MANTRDGWVIPNIHFHDALMKPCIAQWSHGCHLSPAYTANLKGVFHCFRELYGMLFPAYQHVQLEPSPHKACFKGVKWRSLQAGMLVEEVVPGTVRACCYNPSRPGTVSVIFLYCVHTCVRVYICTVCTYLLHAPSTQRCHWHECMCICAFTLSCSIIKGWVSFKLIKRVIGAYLCQLHELHTSEHHCVCTLWHILNQCIHTYNA